MNNLLKFFKFASAWSKKYDALDKDGRPIDLNCFSSSDDRVYSLSLQGAIAYFFSYEKSPDKRNIEMQKLSKAIEKYTGKKMYVAEFNKREETTHEDILNVLKIANTK
jgi:hypothetical protein